MRTMRKILPVVVSCMFMWGYCVFGADEDIIKKTIKVSVSHAQPPQAKTSGTAVANSSSSKDQWVQVDVKFRTEDVKNFRLRYFNDVELAVELAVYSTNEKERCLVFSGKVNYWFVEQDGKDHNMKVLLPAPFFRRFAEGRSVDRVVFVARAVLSLSDKYRVVAYGSNKNVATKDMEVFFRMFPINTIIIKNTLSGRQGTPWSMVEVNKFEFEKQPWLSDVRLEPVTRLGRPAVLSNNSSPAGKNKRTKKNK